jgi:hypothetical protein
VNDSDNECQWCGEDLDPRFVPPQWRALRVCDAECLVDLRSGQTRGQTAIPLPPQGVR